ncbi:MAG: FAD/NAD(P)-binding oxidoreductase [Thermocladium sp.]
MKRVLILGAGAAGLMIANRLARELRTEISNGEVEVALMDKGFTHKLQAGFTYLPFGIFKPSDLTRPIRSLVNPRIRLMLGDVGTVEEINACDRVVKTKTGNINYDYLIIASGAEYDYDFINGLRGAGLTYYDEEGAIAIRNALRGFSRGTIVTVAVEALYKCPGAPNKFNLLLDSYLRNIHGGRSDISIITLWPTDHVHAQRNYHRAAMEEYEARGIDVRLNWILDSIDAGNKTLDSLDGEKVKYDLLIYIPKHVGSTPARGLSKDPDGWLNVDRNSLNLIIDRFRIDDVYVAGDAGPPWITKAASNAHYEAPVIVSNIISDLGGHGYGYGSYWGETICPFVSDAPSSINHQGRAWIPIWTYDAITPAFRGIGYGWMFNLMYLDMYWDVLVRGLV